MAFKESVGAAAAAVWSWTVSTARTAGRLAVRYPLALAATVFLIVGALALRSFGSEFQIGGVLGWLWGKKPPAPGPIVLPPPPGRVDDKGNPIEPGKPDENGFVQIPAVLPIKEPGILSDPNVVVVTHDGKDVELQLPKGVKNKDVKEVVVISPNVYQIGNNDRPVVDAGKLLEDLSK